MAKPNDEDFPQLSEKAFQRIQAAMPAGSRISPAMCECAAILYWDEQRRLAASSGRGVKADLKALERTISSARTALEHSRLQAMSLVAVVELVRGGEARTLPRIKSLTAELAWLENALIQARGAMRRPLRGPHSQFLLLAIGILMPAFERATGRPATHSAHRDGEYMAEPLSPFGRLVVAFFQEVDPQIPARTLASAIRKHLADDPPRVAPKLR